MKAGIIVEVTPEAQWRSCAGRDCQSRSSGAGTNASCARALDGLLRDKTRPPGKAPLDAKIVKRIVDLTLADPPGETTHWTGRAMADAAGVSLRSVQRVWMAHGLAPYRIRTFKLSKDKRFVEKLADVAGLYIDRWRTRSCCRSMRNRKSRPSTAHSQDCR